VNAEQQRIAGEAAELIDSDDEVWQLAADAIASSRDKAPRLPDDRDSGQVVNDLIAALRAAA
jgi:hypothetical protein